MAPPNRHDVIAVDAPLRWRELARIAAGASLQLSPAAAERIRHARRVVEAIVAGGIRAYGINTGVGALCDVVVDRPKQRALSRNILMSHAVGVGPALGRAETRAIIAAAINNFARGHSGVRWEIVERLGEFLAHDCLPEVPAGGSVGYLSHMAHAALPLIGAGHVRLGGARLAAGEGLRNLGLAPLVLEAKEGLSLVNGTPCATGLMACAMQRIEGLLEWADAVAAMSFENLQGQVAAFDAAAMRLRASPGLLHVGESLRSYLSGSALLAAAAGKRTQDALSLRAVPQLHGSARDAFDAAAVVVDRELAAVTDNPVVAGTPDAPEVYSEAHAVGAAIGMSADALAVAVAAVAAMSERRIDRLVNPLVSRLPAFLATDSGAGSGFMIAQYTAVSLVAENRRLASPASLDGGVTSALQEDHLVHATPAVLKLLKIVDNAQILLAIEWLAAAQAYDLQSPGTAPAPATGALHRRLRQAVATYRDDRPLADDIARAAGLLRSGSPSAQGRET
jgi:histidine ammonia-lyase